MREGSPGAPWSRHIGILDVPDNRIRLHLNRVGPELSESLESAESGLPFSGVRNSARDAAIIAHRLFALVQALVKVSGCEISAVDIKTGS